MDFGKRLKESRIKRGLRQEELAYQVNQKINGSIKRNTISNYENNVSHPDYDTLRALAEVLDTSLDVMLEVQAIDLQSFVAESKAEYASSKTLMEAIEKMEEISTSAKSGLNKEGLAQLLSDSTELNQQLIEYLKKLYAKNKQAIEFISKGLDIE